jgi:hypothetical protein
MNNPDWWTAIFTGVLAVTAVGALIYAGLQLSALTREPKSSTCFNWTSGTAKVR